MSTHPAEVNEHLALAHAGCRRLIADAERRGDLAGAAAWQLALATIEAAERGMRDAREQQTWGREEVTPPPHRCTCAPGTRSVQCKAHTCCAVYRLRGQSVTKQCTAQRGHDGAHRNE